MELFTIMPFLFVGILSVNTSKDSVHTVLVCQPKSYTIICPPQEFIEIIKADYGRPDQRLRCIPKNAISKRNRRGLYRHCNVDVTRNVTGLCDGRQDCLLPVDNTAFETPCKKFAGGEYLLMQYKCSKVTSTASPVIKTTTKSKNGFSGKNPFESKNTTCTYVNTPVLNAVSNNSSFIRTDQVYKSKYQYVTGVEVAAGALNKGAIIFTIHQVEKLEDIAYANITDEVIVNGLDRLTEKTAELKFGQGDVCQKSSSNREFCMYSKSGYLFTTDSGPSAIPKSLRRYEVVVQATNSINCSSNTTLRINTVLTCFPMDLLYSNVAKFCPRDKRTFSDVRVQTWPTHIYQVFVNSGIVLGQIQIDTSFTSQFTNNNYTLYLKTSTRNYTVRFEYTISGIEGSRSELHSRVSGKKFRIVFYKEIFLDQPDTVSITITYNGGYNKQFFKKEALILVGSKRLISCPSGLCLTHFQRWRSNYQHLIKQARQDCALDEELYYSYLSYCFVTPIILISPKTFVYRQPIELSCEGIRVDTDKNDIQWYKDKVKIESSGILKLSGEELRQEGDYQCGVANSKGRLVKSTITRLKFKGSFQTNLVFKISKQSYLSQEKRKGNYMALSLLRSKIVEVLSFTKAVTYSQVYDVHIENVTDSSLQDETDEWVKITADGRGILRPDVSIATYYNNIKLDGDHLYPFGYRENSLTMQDRDYCLPETTSKSSSYGEFSWNLTLTSIIQSLPCNYGNQTASRKCVLSDEGKTAMWKEPYLKACLHESELSKELNDILENLSGTTSIELSSKLKNLTTESKSFSTTDTIMTNKILEHIGETSTSIDYKTAKNMLEITGNIMEINRTTLEQSQKEGKALKGIIQSLEIVAGKIITNTTAAPSENTTAFFQISTKHVGLAVIAEKNSAASFTGEIINIVPSQSAGNSREGVAFVRNPNGLDVNDGIVVDIPNTLFKDVNENMDNTSVMSLQFIYFNDASLFPILQTDGRHTTNNTKVISGVFSLRVGANKHVKLSKDMEFSIGTGSNSVQQKGHYSCVFWDFKTNNGYGSWSRDGCKTMISANQKVTCRCNHLTNFAVLFTHDMTSFEKLDEGHQLALTLISYIGCSISLAGIIFTLLTLLLFRNMRHKVPSKVLIGLSSSIGMLLVIFMIFIDRKHPPWLCTGTSTLIHFLILNCFCWMLVEATTLYLKVVKVMGEYTSNFMIKATVGTFFVPSLLVGLCVGFNLDDYQDNLHCMVSGTSLYYGLLLPVCLIILINGIIFVLVVCSLRKNTSSNSKNKLGDSADIMTQVRIAASCCTLLGLTWLFGMLAITEVRLAFQYLFCIFNSLQGAFIFYFNILRQSRTIEAWKGFLSGKGRNYNCSSSSASNSKSKSTLFKRNAETNDSEPLPLPLSVVPQIILSPETSDDDGDDSQAEMFKRSENLLKETPASELSFSSFAER